MTAVAAGAVTIWGCASAPKAAGRKLVSRPSAAPALPETDNIMCPISGLPIGPGAPVVGYRGLKIGFCCPACVTPWKLMNEAGKHKLVTRVATQAPPR